jgi:SUMO ligase MMS21 Smc5/6 complex component
VPGKCLKMLGRHPVGQRENEVVPGAECRKRVDHQRYRDDNVMEMKAKRLRRSCVQRGPKDS